MAVYTAVAKTVTYSWPNRGYTEQDVKAIEDTVLERLSEADRGRVRFIYGDERSRGVIVRVKLNGDDDMLGTEVERLVVETMAS